LECLRLFRLEHPGVNLYRASSDGLKEDVLTGESNAALLFDNHLENTKGFEQMPLFSSRFMYVLSHGHSLAGKKELTARDIADCEFIFSNSGRIDDQGIFGHIACTAQALGIRKEQVRFCKNFESIFAEVATGRVITLVDEYVSFLNDQYATIPTGLKHNVVAAWKAGAGAPPLDRLLTYLKRELSRDPSTSAKNPNARGVLSP
jgi:DNA-binding transcriptional LysR family regulator